MQSFHKPSCLYAIHKTTTGDRIEDIKKRIAIRLKYYIPY